VPSEDLRALRRAIVDLDEFHASADGSEDGKATLTTGLRPLFLQVSGRVVLVFDGSPN